MGHDHSGEFIIVVLLLDCLCFRAYNIYMFSPLVIFYCLPCHQGELAFGKKGRPASAGKPRIPSDATITFDCEVVGLPGKEVELIELIGD